MKYKWNDTAEKLSRITNELGIDSHKLEKACELAAYKIYPVYKAFNLEMGDKVPSLYYLKQIIFELSVGQIDDPTDTYSWGGISLQACRYGEEDNDDDYYAINIDYHINSVWYEDIKTK